MYKYAKRNRAVNSQFHNFGKFVQKENTGHKFCSKPSLSRDHVLTQDKPVIANSVLQQKLLCILRLHIVGIMSSLKSQVLLYWYSVFRFIF